MRTQEHDTTAIPRSRPASRIEGWSGHPSIGQAGKKSQDDRRPHAAIRGLALALLLALLLGPGCSKPTAPTHTNPADPDNPDFVPPGVTLWSPDEGDWMTAYPVRFYWHGTGAASQYRYRMDGSGWSAWDNDTVASFTSLAEGPHTFEVMAGDAGFYEGPVTAVRHVTMNYYSNALMISVSPATVQVGDTVELACVLEDMGTPVAGARLYLYVNFTYLDTVGVTADTGYQWRQHGGTPVGPLFSTYSTNVLDVSVGAAGGTPAGVTGSGRIFKIKAVAKAVGNTSISYYTTPVVRDTLNATVSTTQASATVTILAK